MAVKQVGVQRRGFWLVGAGRWGFRNSPVGKFPKLQLRRGEQIKQRIQQQAKVNVKPENGKTRALRKQGNVQKCAVQIPNSGGGNPKVRSSQVGGPPRAHSPSQRGPAFGNTRPRRPK